MRFGDKLSQLRKKNGLSQEELGEKLDVTRQTISKWELGQSKPDANKLVEISKLLDIDFNILINDNMVIEKENKDDNDDVRPRKWLLIVLIAIAVVIIIILANKYITDMKNNNNDNNVFDVFDGFDISKEVFNSTFEFYSGTKVGISVSILIDDVITNNKKNKEHLISINYDGINSSDVTEIQNMKKKIASNDDYEVLIDYDNNGFVNTISIVLVEDVNDFNRMFEFHAGDNYGIPTREVLDDIITSNKKNNTHLITVVFNGVFTTDENEIRNIKRRLDDWTKYDLIFDYDNDGFINKLTIDY